MALYSNDAPYCLLPSCKKLEIFNYRFQRKCPKPNFLTLNLQIKIFFSKFLTCHFFYFIDLQLHAKFQKNLISGIYRRMDRQTKEGYYYGPHRVNQRSKNSFLRRQQGYSLKNKLISYIRSHCHGVNISLSTEIKYLAPFRRALFCAYDFPIIILGDILALFLLLLAMK